MGESNPKYYDAPEHSFYLGWVYVSRRGKYRFVLWTEDESFSRNVSVFSFVKTLKNRNVHFDLVKGFGSLSDFSHVRSYASADSNIENLNSI